MRIEDVVAMFEQQGATRGKTVSPGSPNYERSRDLDFQICKCSDQDPDWEIPEYIAQTPKGAYLQILHSVAQEGWTGCTSHGFDVQAAAAAFGAAGVVKEAGHVANVLDAGQADLGMCTIARSDGDRADIEKPLDQSLPEADVVHVDDFDAVRHAAENALFMHESLIGE